MWRRNKFTFTRFRGSSTDAHPWHSLGSSLISFSSFIFFRFLVKNDIYLRFLDSMFSFELLNRVWSTWQTATELDRPWQTLADLGLPSRNKPSSYGHTPSCVKVCHVLLRSPRSTTAHLSWSIPPWLPWQLFWLFKNLSRQPRRATFVDPVPLPCDTVTPFRPR